MLISLPPAHYHARGEFANQSLMKSEFQRFECWPDHELHRYFNRTTGRKPTKILREDKNPRQASQYNIQMP